MEINPNYSKYAPSSTYLYFPLEGYLQEFEVGAGCVLLEHHVARRARDYGAGPVLAQIRAQGLRALTELAQSL